MNEQMALLDIPVVLAPQPKRKRKIAEKKPDETIHQTLARYAREAAEIRAKLRKEGKIA